MSTRHPRPAMRSLVSLLVLVSQMVTVYAQIVRPTRDSVGFCWDADEMNSFIKYLEANADQPPTPPGNLVAAISVHDDYLYAGKVYYPLFSTLHAKEVVIFGVTHGTVARELGPQSNVIILDEYDRWRGPFGEVGISPLRGLIRERLPAEFVAVNNRAHAIEHSIEALVPFLQHYNRDVTITPIMITRMPLERMQEVSRRLARIFNDYIAANHLLVGRDIMFLMSNDADHYGPEFNNAPYGTDIQAHEIATSNDRRIISSCLSGTLTPSHIEALTAEIWPDSTSKKPIPVWCGRYPITLGLLTVTKLMDQLGQGPIRGSLLMYSDTFTEGVLPVKSTSMGLTAVFSYQHWCGWFTEGFYVTK
jgi:AmmeMemoRadiSam system protein B